MKSFPRIIDITCIIWQVLRPHRKGHKRIWRGRGKNKGRFKKINFIVHTPNSIVSSSYFSTCLKPDISTCTLKQRLTV